MIAGSTVGTGEQTGDGTSDPPAPVTYSIFTEQKTGALVAGDPSSVGGASVTWGNPLFKGITWDDVNASLRGLRDFVRDTGLPYGIAHDFVVDDAFLAQLRQMVNSNG